MLESVRPDINLKTTTRFQEVEARDGVDAQVSLEKQKKSASNRLPKSAWGTRGLASDALNTFLLGFLSRRRLVVSKNDLEADQFGVLFRATQQRKIRTCSRVVLSFSIDKTVLRLNRLQTP